MELLRSLGIVADICPADIDESRLKNEVAKDYVKRLALQKATTVANIKANNLPVLAADTIVALDNQLFGKPKNKDDAMAIWQALSGRTHDVMTAVALLTESNQYQALSNSQVCFKTLNAQEMESYWETGEPTDKAGAYAIQGFASAWVESISGSYSGIVGLPLHELNNLLKKVGLNWL